jgi:hypothetical protein
MRVCDTCSLTRHGPLPNRECGAPNMHWPRECKRHDRLNQYKNTGPIHDRPDRISGPTGDEPDPHTNWANRLSWHRELSGPYQNPCQSLISRVRVHDRRLLECHAVYLD